MKTDIIKNNESFTKRLITFAVPLLLQYLIVSSLNLVDNIMIGTLGEVSIAGVGLGNQIYFLTNLFMFGVIGGATIFFAQFWGKRDIHSIHKTMGISFILTLIIALFFTLAGTIFPRFVIGVYSNDMLVVAEGARYLGIAAFSYIPFAISIVFVFALRATGNVRVPLFASIVALGINTLLNYCLIFGNFGFPELGVQGAAIATIIARSIEAILLIIIVYKNKLPIAAKISGFFTFSFSFFKMVMKKISLVMLNEGVWAIGTTIYSIIYARMGTDVMAVMTICLVIFHLAFIVALGIGQALGIMIGNSLGAKDFDRAKSDAKKGLPTAVICGVIVAAIMFALRSTILSFYNVEPEIIKEASVVLYAMIGMLPLNCLGFTLFIGILRAGGDTKFCTIVDIGALWLVGLPLAALGAFVWHLPILFVFILARMESVSRVIVCFIRYRSFRWVKDITEGG